ncbi:hypothetical protein [Arthrobacter sp. QXT-31]|uniref:hypothetical protein n=1 Tax=Arthrobacter sp. QXT-31 TaxID=1357915 RepID=UPI000971B74F|nr:hypothetical protein [Arthrobacter sp. QXT-31]APX03962.1 hypothetical protein BWQ92_21555 [Arthrobacter sp. QXT-31]
MTRDIKAMLDRVVHEVFKEDFAIVNQSSDEPARSPSVQVSSRSHEDRQAVIRVDPVWVEGFIPELNVQTALLIDDGEEEDDDELEAYREAELMKLCRVMRAYLQGGGHVTTRRRLFGRGNTFVLKIEVDGFEWRLGQNYWAGPKPI